MKKLVYPLLALLFIVASCQPEDTQKKNEIKNTEAAKVDTSNQGKSDKLENLLSEVMLRRTFTIQDSIGLESHSEDSTVKYEWAGYEEPGHILRAYNVSLKLENGVEKDKNKKKDIQEITGIGDGASWLKDNGGKLQVNSGGKMFSISMSTKRLNRSDMMPSGNNPKWTNQFKLEKSKELALGVVTNLQK